VNQIKNAEWSLWEGNTEVENNGYVVFKRISMDQLGNRVVLRGET
jgi:hypothetical protein